MAKEKKYYKKTIIYAEEKIHSLIGPKSSMIVTTGKFETIEDVTDQKKELFKCYGHF